MSSDDSTTRNSTTGPDKPKKQSAVTTDHVVGALVGLGAAVVAGIGYLFYRSTEEQSQPSEPPQTADHLGDDCKVCFANKVDCALFPCKHYALCSGCAAKVAQCPICRTTITRRERLFNC